VDAREQLGKCPLVGKNLWRSAQLARCVRAPSRFASRTDSCRRGDRAGCGALAATFFLNFPPDKVRDREGAITNTRGECAARSDQFLLFALIRVFRGWFLL
jgi:hypothetical protein